jgi:hypothetical protein
VTHANIGLYFEISPEICRADIFSEWLSVPPHANLPYNNQLDLLKKIEKGSIRALVQDNDGSWMHTWDWAPDTPTLNMQSPKTGLVSSRPEVNEFLLNLQSFHSEGTRTVLITFFF